jgi:hypothetical protein
VLPEGDFVVVRQRFEVNFEHVYLNSKRLTPARLGYKVKHKSALKGRREGSPIWRYGVELEYLNESGLTVNLWLCKDCHLARELNDAKVVSGTHHVTLHLQRVHRINPKTGLLPEASPALFSSRFEAAKVAGTGTMISHTPWQEEALQSSLVDWVITRDVSFATATSPAFRGLLTWNRSTLLPALPSSKSTLRQYILTSLEERKVEIWKLLAAARSRVSISVDVWTSSNYLSFLGVVAHFVGKFFEVSNFPAFAPT